MQVNHSLREGFSHSFTLNLNGSIFYRNPMNHYRRHTPVCTSGSKCISSQMIDFQPLTLEICQKKPKRNSICLSYRYSVLKLSACISVYYYNDAITMMPYLLASFCDFTWIIIKEHNEAHKYF